MQKMYINGEWIDAVSGKTRSIINPFNQDEIANIPEGSRKEAIHAIQAARLAFDEGDWPKYTGEARGEVLYKVAEKILEYKNELAKLETLDTGKTLVESEADMEDIANSFQYFAGLADMEGEQMIDSPIPNSVSRVVREPVGVCAQITPWNYPLLQASWKLAPALAAGNTLVLKPSEITPLTTMKMFEIFEEVGLPKGVVNLVLGPGDTVGAELSENDQVDLISFTGGAETGRKIMRAAAGSMKKISFELGGNSPNIIFADADFETAVDYALNAVFFHAGQVCSAGSRLIVEASIHDTFVEAIVEKAKLIRMGNGFEKETQMGPVISAEHREKIERYIQLGLKEGAEMILGGKRPNDPDLQKGFFIEPTIFTNCHTKMRIVQEEIFGPVITIEKFDTEEEAIRLANDSKYGLAGAVWTQDINRAENVVSKLRMGTVWINDFNPYIPQAPWGGYKQSGIGRELGMAGLDEYTELKHIYKNIDPKPLKWF